MQTSNPRSADADPFSQSGLACLLWTLALGVFWMLLEFGHGVAAQPLFDPHADLGKFLRYLPAQLSLFALIGLPLAVLVRLSSISTEVVSWLRFWAALLVFLGSSAAIGTFRDSRSILAAATTFAEIGGSLAVLVAALAALGRLLPRDFRALWPTACVIGGSFLAVPVISRASAPLRLGSLDPSDLVTTAQPIDWGVAIAVVAASLAFLRAGRLLGIWITHRNAVILVGVIAVAGAGPEIARAESKVEHPDVIVILVDALRPDVLGAYGRSPSLTPNLDKLASESIVFERAYAAGNRTARSMPVVMTSLSPAVVGERIAEGAHTLAEYLKDAGYATFGISANPHVSQFFGYQQGFDAFFDPTVAPDYLVMNPLKVVGRFFASHAYDWGLISSGLYYPTIPEMRSRASMILKKTPRPIFLYLHTMDLHGPYLPPKRFLSTDYRPSDFISYYDLISLAGDSELMEDESQRARLLNARQRYDGELRFTDEELGHLFEELRNSGRWEEALVWIVSDHGEAFGEHNYAGHAGFNVFSTLLHVPMILKPPRSLGLQPAVVSEPVSNADILPTTLAVVGLDPPDPTFGMNLLNTDERSPRPISLEIVSDVHYPEGRLLSVIEGDWKLDAFLSNDADDITPTALFNLSQDPLEERDLLMLRKDVVEPLAEVLRARIEAEGFLSLRSDEVEVDAEMKERLRSLGYVVD